MQLSCVCNRRVDSNGLCDRRWSGPRSEIEHFRNRFHFSSIFAAGEILLPSFKTSKNEDAIFYSDTPNSQSRKKPPPKNHFRIILFDNRPTLWHHVATSGVRCSFASPSRSRDSSSSRSFFLFVPSLQRSSPPPSSQKRSNRPLQRRTLCRDAHKRLGTAHRSARPAHEAPPVTNRALHVTAGTPRRARFRTWSAPHGDSVPRHTLGAKALRAGDPKKVVGVTIFKKRGQVFTFYFYTSRSTIF